MEDARVGLDGTSVRQERGFLLPQQTEGIVNDRLCEDGVNWKQIGFHQSEELGHSKLGLKRKLLDGERVVRNEIGAVSLTLGILKIPSAEDCRRAQNRLEERRISAQSPMRASGEVNQRTCRHRRDSDEGGEQNIEQPQNLTPCGHRRQAATASAG